MGADTMAASIKPSNTLFTVVIPKTLKAEVEAHAKNACESMGVITRAALRQYLADHAKPEEKKEEIAA
jgi:metal-responsive CopG/Arc/MetJ family transcriptional regulator